MPEPPTASSIRLFVAVALPDEVKERMQETQNELKASAGEAAVRWTRPEQFHLTLRFLGNVDSSRIEALKQSLGAVCAGFPPLCLRAADVGFFPGPRRPRVVWVGISDAAGILTSLHEGIQTATAGFTSESREERFAGHVTLGRVKEIHSHDAERLTAAAARFSHREFGAWTACETQLVWSQLSPKGASHTVLHAFPLQSDHRNPPSP